MKESEWISVNDKLPDINKKIEVKRQRLCFRYSPQEGFFSKASQESVYCFTDLFNNQINVSHWRPIQEKRSDFSKLKKGDLIIIVCDNNSDSKVGYIANIHNDGIETSRYEDTKASSNIVNAFSEIKKITRINLEEKTFEEI